MGKMFHNFLALFAIFNCFIHPVVLKSVTPDIEPSKRTPYPQPNLAAYPSPDEDGTYFVVNLSEVPLENQVAVEDDNKNITFHLYTREGDKEVSHEILIGEENPSWLSVFKPNASLKILCHGYKSSPEKPFPAEMRFFLTGNSVNVNVVLVGWENLAKSDFYQSAVQNVRKVGKRASDLVQYLLGLSVVDLKKVHIIGHNLGAHIGGIVGNLVQKATGNRVGRITGLDPAGLKECDLKLRLDESDAEFVDAIHTDDGNHCGDLWVQKKNQREAFMRNWGFQGQVGHLDYFPNGGKNQPWKSESLGNFRTDTCGLCRSYQLMTQYLQNPNSTDLIACKCESWESYEDGQCKCDEKVILGEPFPRKRGAFFLRTDGDETKRQ